MKIFLPSDRFEILFKDKLRVVVSPLDRADFLELADSTTTDKDDSPDKIRERAQSGILNTLRLGIREVEIIGKYTRADGSPIQLSWDMVRGKNRLSTESVEILFAILKDATLIQLSNKMATANFDGSIGDSEIKYLPSNEEKKTT